MRYVRKQIVVKVLADEIIEDLAIVKQILETFQKGRTDASISYRANQCETATAHDRVRITAVHEDSFDLTVINQTHTMNVKKVPISYIDFLSTTVSPNEIFVRKNGVVEKGDTLDLA
jgi:hypothetical protein